MKYLQWCLRLSLDVPFSFKTVVIRSVEMDYSSASAPHSFLSPLLILIIKCFGYRIYFSVNEMNTIIVVVIIIRGAKFSRICEFLKILSARWMYVLRTLKYGTKFSLPGTVASRICGGIVSVVLFLYYNNTTPLCSDGRLN
jgi:hypothetical protein